MVKYVKIPILYKDKLFKNNEAKIGKRYEQIKNILRGWEVLKQKKKEITMIYIFIQMNNPKTVNTTLI